MYCPNCGQQQISNEMRFCSRCGLALSELVDWLSGGYQPSKQSSSNLGAPTSPRRKGIRRAAKLMFFSGVCLPLSLVFSLAIDEPFPLIPALLIFFASIVLMLYERIFADPNPPTMSQIVQPPTFANPNMRSALPPQTSIPVPPTGRQQVKTNELAQPASVTENTTRLLDNE